MPSTREHASDLRGATRLLLDATEGVTAAVEAMHQTIAGGPALLGRPLAGASQPILGLAYGGVRAVAALVGRGLDESLARLGPRLGASAPGPQRDAVLAVLNGVVGDHLLATGNPLAIPMRLRAPRWRRRPLRRPSVARPPSSASAPPSTSTSTSTPWSPTASSSPTAPPRAS